MDGFSEEEPTVVIVEMDLKCYYDHENYSFFSSDFESVLADLVTGKIVSFDFYPKAVYFKCKFWISWSAVTHVRN